MACRCQKRPVHYSTMRPLEVWASGYCVAVAEPAVAEPAVVEPAAVVVAPAAYCAAG